jgi:hypothetical protein
MALRIADKVVFEVEASARYSISLAEVKVTKFAVIRALMIV